MHDRLFAEFAKSQGLASEMNALRRFDKVKEVIEENNLGHFVIVYNGKYVPVVRLRDGLGHLMHLFIHHKIGVM